MSVPVSPRVVLAAVLTVAAWAAASAAEENPFEAEVLDVRPRVFLRREPFDGLTIEKLRAAVDQPEFAGMREKWRARPLGRAILWMLDGKQDDLRAAVAGLKRMDASGGSWSDRGLTRMALLNLAEKRKDRPCFGLR